MEKKREGCLREKEKKKIKTTAILKNCAIAKTTPTYRPIIPKKKRKE